MYKYIEKLCHKHGFSLVPIASMINGIWITRPDIISVRKSGFHLLTIPKIIYDHPTNAKTLEGLAQPMFYELEHKINSWAGIIQKSDWLKNRENKERELIAMEKNL